MRYGNRLFILSLAALACVAADASAARLGYTIKNGRQHFRMASSEPRNDAVLNVSPHRIVIKFSKPLGDGSTLHLADNAGKNVAGNVDAKGKQISANVTENLPPGRYTVHWTAHCNCGDPDLDDSFSFIVK